MAPGVLELAEGRRGIVLALGAAVAVRSRLLLLLLARAGSEAGALAMLRC